MSSAFEIGFELDRRFRLVHGGTLGDKTMDQSKKPELLLLCELLHDVQYALIGGLALQVHQEEPRTTLDIDIAVSSYDSLPQATMQAAGFKLEERFTHSENWRGPQGTPVQFSDDAAFADAIASAEVYPLEGHKLRVINCKELVRAKLRAALDPARRKSKRMQDLADVQGLLERYPDIESLLSAAERARLG
jgi:predicted nucleotidyltransferase